MNVSKKLLLSLVLGASLTASSLSAINLIIQTSDHHNHQVSVSPTGVVTWRDGLNAGHQVLAEYILSQVRAQLATITATVEPRIAAMEPRVAAIETEIREVIQPHLAALDHRMDTFEGRIAILTEQNNVLQSAVRGFDGQIRDHEGRILDIAGRMTIIEQTLAHQARALEQEHQNLTEAQQGIATSIEVPHVAHVAEALHQAAPDATPEQFADLQRQLTVQGTVITELARQADEQARFTQDHEARIRTMKKVLIVGGIVLGLTIVGGGIGFIVLGTKLAALSKAVGFLGMAVNALRTTVTQHAGLIEGLGHTLTTLTGTVTTGLFELRGIFAGLGGRVSTLEAGMGTLQTTVATLGQTVERHESAITIFAQYLRAKAASWNPFF